MPEVRRKDQNAKMDNGEKMVTHQEQLHLVMKEFQSLFKKCRIWQNQTGVARSMDGSRFIKYGCIGSADITGIMDDGTRVEIEIKVKRDKQRESQKNFETMIRQCNGIYIIIDDKSDIKEQLCRHLKKYLKISPLDMQTAEKV
jgi:hypothetical protein